MSRLPVTGWRLPAISLNGIWLCRARHHALHGSSVLLLAQRFSCSFFVRSKIIRSFFARPKNEPKKGGLKSFLGLTF
jgi:hypothetical protein